MVRRRTPDTAEHSPDELRAFLAVFKARLAHSPESVGDWAEDVRPEVVAMVGEGTADRLIEAEMLREADEFRRRAETQPRGPFGHISQQGGIHGR